MGDGKRYCSCSSTHGFSVPLPLFSFFTLFCLHLSIAAAAGNPPLPLNNTQESIMRDLSRSVGSAGWNTTVSNPCLWRGIGCSPSNSSSFLVVTKVDLSGYSISNSTLFASLCSLDTLHSLDLSNNYFANLTGHFSPCPMTAGLRVLNFSSNRLSGRLGHLSGFSRLEVLDLSFNSFLGTVTTQLSVMPRLRSLNLSSNYLVGAVPLRMASSMEELVLSRNSFSDSIPSSLFSYSDLTLLDLSQNSFTGDVVDEFRKLPKLRTLILSGNNLTGAIPASLSNVMTLTRFAANQNNFTGSVPSVPSSLEGLQSLTKLVLSYNHLSGSLPAFRSSVTVDSTGNPDLTNGKESSNDSPTSRKTRTHTVVIIVAIVSSLVGLCLLAAIVMFALSKRIYRVEDEGPSTEVGVCQVIDGHFITMSSVHTSGIDFRYAVKAVSNPNNIFLKTRFCTYYKAMMPNGSIYSVKKLDWSDKIFHVGSQEKFGHELEVLGKLSNSSVMVPLAYVLTEDNAYLLYEHVYKSTVFDLLHDGRSHVLDWTSRYSIALGVAQGLTFLHGRTQPVLLLDLSTRTIHLKSTNEPQIGDIELYKIIDPSKSSGSLSTIAGTVGYIPPGKPSVSDGMELAKWALSLSARPEQREQVLDTRVSRTSVGVHSQMLSVLNIALSCVTFSPDARPKMRNVLRLLANAK
ncbi:hypothetical protein ZWY2020_028510 [Hordeum vulgare]|nr:hypothetical protein ZWY2020_028510 [Hordeum vulgare]